MLMFGGSGLLGTRIRELLSTRYLIVAPVRADVDLMVRNDVEKMIEKMEPDVIVYAAGETNVDIVEKNREYAMKINNEVVSWIAKRADFNSIPLIYFSSDAVFKGNQSERPYKETDAVFPINYYGATKAKGEEAVYNASDKNLIIRLIILYTSVFPYKLDFARNILKKLSGKLPCYGIIDLYCNPTFSDDAVYGLSAAIDKNVSGILHFGATDYVTNYHLAQEIALRFGYEKDLILPTSLLSFFKGKIAKRPSYAWLDTTKAQKLLGKGILHTNSQNVARFHKTFLHFKN